MGDAATSPRIDATFTMLPSPAASIERPTSWHRWNGATALMSIVDAKWSSVSDSAGVGSL